MHKELGVDDPAIEAALYFDRLALRYLITFATRAEFDQCPAALVLNDEFASEDFCDLAFDRDRVVGLHLVDRRYL